MVNPCFIHYDISTQKITLDFRKTTQTLMGKGRPNALSKIISFTLLIITGAVSHFGLPSSWDSLGRFDGHVLNSAAYLLTLEIEQISPYTFTVLEWISIGFKLSFTKKLYHCTIVHFFSFLTTNHKLFLKLHTAKCCMELLTISHPVNWQLCQCQRQKIREVLHSKAETENL